MTGIRDRTDVRTDRRPAARVVMVLEVLLAAGALGGAVGLVSGSMTLGDSVDELPFRSAAFGGVCLALVNGVVPLVASVAEWRRAPWAPWAHLVAGTALMGWIVVQVAFIGLVSFMQPALFAWGVAIAGLGWRLAPPVGRDRPGAGSGAGAASG